METTDRDLVEQCLAGDAEAYGELIQRYQDPVFNLLMKLTGNWHEASDLTQEAFIRSYRKLGSYDPRFSFKNWVITIAVNLAKNRFRSVFRRHRTEEQSGGPVESRGTDPRIEAVDEVLADLPEKLRVPLVLKHMEGYSYEEIAQTLRIGVSAAKMRVLRAREEFVRRMEP
jgi:RNA polymerase sigma-70 factor, ECF subfamily